MPTFEEKKRDEISVITFEAAGEFTFLSGVFVAVAVAVAVVVA